MLSRFNAADHSLYKELQEAIGGDASQPTQDDEDEDVMIAGGTQAELAPNSKCPLSGRAVSIYAYVQFSLLICPFTLTMYPTCSDPKITLSPLILQMPHMGKQSGVGTGHHCL